MKPKDNLFNYKWRIFTVITSSNYTQPRTLCSYYIHVYVLLWYQTLCNDVPYSTSRVTWISRSFPCTVCIGCALHTLHRRYLLIFQLYIATNNKSYNLNAKITIIIIYFCQCFSVLTYKGIHWSIILHYFIILNNILILIIIILLANNVTLKNCS